MIFAKNRFLDKAQLLKQKAVAGPPINSTSKETEKTNDNVVNVTYEADETATTNGKFWMKLWTRFEKVDMEFCLSSFPFLFFFSEFKVKTKKRVIGPVL